MRPVLLWTVGLCLGVLPAIAQQERRELGPHEHGAGTLNIAIEGNKVSMDLSAPANDILGFEHQPSTPEQTQALAKAKETLGKPLDLIALPAAAGCTIESANVAFNAADPTGGAPAKDQPKKDESQHADFDVDYVLACKAPEKIVTMAFPYFKQFAGAQKLTVTVVSDKGQSQYDVSRDTPNLTLK